MPFTLSHKDTAQLPKIPDLINNFTPIINNLIYIINNPIHILQISDKVMNAVQDPWPMEHEGKAMADTETPEEKTPDPDHSPCSDSHNTSSSAVGRSTTDATKLKIQTKMRTPRHHAPSLPTQAPMEWNRQRNDQRPME